MIEMMDGPSQREAEWNAWYDDVYLPSRRKIRGFLSARCFTMIEGRPKYFIVYDLASADAIASEAYIKLRDREMSSPRDSFEELCPSCQIIHAAFTFRSVPTRSLHGLPGFTPGIIGDFAIWVGECVRSPERVSFIYYPFWKDIRPFWLKETSFGK